MTIAVLLCGCECWTETADVLLEGGGG